MTDLKIGHYRVWMRFCVVESKPRRLGDGGYMGRVAAHGEGGEASAVSGVAGVFFNCCSATCTLVQSLGLRLVAFGALGSE